VTLPVEHQECTMGLMEHLRELRKRLFYSLIAIGMGAVVAYWYSTEMFALLCAPYFQAFGNSPLIGTGPAEAWLLKIKVAVFAGCILTSPFIFYQLWLFVAPGLYSSERRLIIPFVISSTLLFTVGATFCYTQILPLTLRFFYDEFRSVGITPTIKISDHLSITITTVLGFGAVFEMPLLSFFLARAGIIDHRFLMRWFRHAVVVIFVIAAALTPPDVLTQLLMAGPLLILYGISIAIAYFSHPKTIPPTVT
jgi:sec-independent protein translocase protein TatC